MCSDQTTCRVELGLAPKFDPEIVMQAYALTVTPPVQIANIVSGFEVDTAVERVFLNVTGSSTIQSMIDYDANNGASCCLPDDIGCVNPCRADCRFYSPG